MTPHPTLQQRREALEHRSTVLRERLAVHGQALAPAFEAAEQVRDAGRWLRDHPWVPALLAAALVLRRPRRALRWGWRLVSGGRWLWRLAQVWGGLRGSRH